MFESVRDITDEMMKETAARVDEARDHERANPTDQDAVKAHDDALFDYEYLEDVIHTDEEVDGIISGEYDEYRSYRNLPALTWENQDKLYRWLERNGYGRCRTLDNGHLTIDRTIKPLEVACNTNYQEILARLSNRPRPIPTGLEPLDAMLGGGLEPGITLLGGAPAQGKSALALEIALYSAIHKHPTIYVSTELPNDEVLARVLSMISVMYCDRDSFAYGNALRDADSYFTQMSKAMDKFYQLHLDDYLALYDDVLAVDEVDGISSDLAAANDGGGALLVIDHLHELEPPSTELRSLDEYATEQVVSKAVMHMGKSHSVAVLAVAELNKAGLDGRTDEKPPTLVDFKGAGSIPYRSVNALVIRKGDDDCSVGGMTTKRLDVLKARHGSTTRGRDAIPLVLDGPHGLLTPGRSPLR
jgi:replicative DNA helicase